MAVCILPAIGTVFLLYDFKNMLFLGIRRHKLYCGWIEGLKMCAIFKALYISVLSIKLALACNKTGGIRGGKGRLKTQKRLFLTLKEAVCEL